MNNSQNTYVPFEGEIPFLGKYKPFECMYNEDIVKIHSDAEVLVKSLVVNGMDEFHAYLLVNRFWENGRSSGELSESFYNSGKDQ